MKKLSSNAPGKTPLLQRIFADNGYCWLSAICSAGISLIIVLAFKMIPFGDITILRMDMYHQYCPLFAELYDRVTGLQSLLYSWQTGLGSSFVGNFYNYLCSPSAIFVLLFGHQNVPEAIAAMIFSKAACASFAFTYYLKKTFKKSDFVTAGFGILYSMCGWFIAYYWDVMWVDSMVFFPFVILGIDRIIRERKPLTYIIALFLTLITNYYMGYMTCLFSVIYFFASYFNAYGIDSLDGKEDYWTSVSGKRSVSFFQRLRHSQLTESGVTFGLGSLAAGGLAAFALVPVYFVLQTSYATSDTFPSDWSSYFTIFDFLANHLTSLEPTIRSSGDVVLPNIYCGMVAAMLVPLYFYVKSIPVKEKIINIALLGILFASFNFNKISFIWHGFHYPSDLPYRFSFMYSFVLLVMAYKTFTKLNEFTGRQILGTGMAIILFVIMTQKVGSKNVEDLSVILSIIFTVTYTIVFVASRDPRYQQSAVSVLLLCCIIGEVACCNTSHYDIDQPKDSFAGDLPYFEELKSEIDEEEQGSFYRMELTYNRARMDPAWFGYNGVSTFTSMAYESLSKLEKKLGLAGNNVDSYTYYLQTPVYNLMHSIKYIFDNTPDVTVEDDYYEELSTKGKFTAYRNNYYLPIAYAVKSDVEGWLWEEGNPFTMQSQWFELATGVSDVFERMTINEDDISYYNIDDITSGLTGGNIYYNKTTNGQDGEITFFLSTEKTQHCYLYVSSSDFDSISISRGDKTVSQSIDDPYVYDLGICEPEDTVTVIVSIDDTSDYGSFEFHPYAVNDAALQKGYDILSANAINISSFKDTKFTGTIAVPEGGMIYTSVPYDEGWSISLNGKEVPAEDILALGTGFTCIKAEPGTYTVEFKFAPKGMLIGLGVTAATILVLLAVWLILRQKKHNEEEAEKEQLQPAVTDNADETAEQPTEVPIEFELEAGENLYFADYAGGSDKAEPAPEAEEPAPETETENGDTDSE